MTDVNFYPPALPFSRGYTPGDILTLTPDSSLLYLCLEWFNFVRKYNFDILEKNAEDRPDGVPLVTVCNHSSCLDDPCLWGKTYFSLIICLRNVFARNYWQSLWISGEFPTGEKVFELFPTFQNSIRLFFGNVNILNIRTRVILLIIINPLSAKSKMQLKCVFF